MLREIHIDSFNKIITNYKVEVFNSLTVVESRAYNPQVEHYIGISSNMQHMIKTKIYTKSTSQRKSFNRFYKTFSLLSSPRKFYSSKPKKTKLLSRKDLLIIFTSICLLSKTKARQLPTSRNPLLGLYFFSLNPALKTTTHTESIITL